MHIACLITILDLLLDLDCRVQSVLFHSDRLYKGIETMAFTVQSKICIFGQESLDIPYLKGKSPLVMSNIQVKIRDILPETSKSSAFWDMGVDSHLKWLRLFSPDVALTSRTAPVYYETWPESTRGPLEQQTSIPPLSQLLFTCLM